MSHSRGAVALTHVYGDGGRPVRKRRRTGSVTKATSYPDDVRNTTIAAPLRVITTMSPLRPGRVVTTVSDGGGTFTRQAVMLLPLVVWTVMPTPLISGPFSTNCT